MAQFWSGKRNSSATLSDEEVSPRGFSACGSDIVPPCAAKQNKAKFVEGRKSFSLSSIKSSQGRGNFFDDVVYEELIKLGFASLLSLFFPSANDSIRANEPSESVRHFCSPPSGWEKFVFTQRCRPSKKLLTKFFIFMIAASNSWHDFVARNYVNACRLSGIHSTHGWKQNSQHTRNVWRLLVMAHHLIAVCWAIASGHRAKG